VQHSSTDSENISIRVAAQGTTVSSYPKQQYNLAAAHDAQRALAGVDSICRQAEKHVEDTYVI
jgi:hypothetical protein